MMGLRFFAAFFCAAFLGGVFASGAVAGDGAVAVEAAYTRETPASGKVGAVFARIVNAGGQDDRLLGVESSVAGHAEIHDMVMDGDIMKMRAMDGVDIPAGAEVLLSPTGLHIMLLDLKTPLVAGTMISVTFSFKQAGRQVITVPVRALKEK